MPFNALAHQVGKLVPINIHDSELGMSETCLKAFKKVSEILSEFQANFFHNKTLRVKKWHTFLIEINMQSYW